MNNEFHFAPNQCRPGAGAYCGGQPTDEQIAAFAREGGECVINLRPLAEQAGWDEAAAVKAHGMTYVHIPVANPDDLTRDAAAKLAQATQQHDVSRMLIHCASGQRVGALVALKAGWIDGQSVDEAIATGREAGLDRLEPVVRAKLQAG
ncbi:MULTISPECIES: sulfur transferase domain-containing protein [Oleiagrimonas]|uniref:Serine/threonine protein phosphatase n=1 Tax=Oleiagrimonas citrea TaxID=1665687 RepID=A0A846ZKV0_9GAMM|nr:MULTISPECIES: sulfur transferase domain-containing protein [Oleiagrimonas]NKZ38317.1 serine/threonine protein phosphatase [Oleiagrimonas citrea]RAP58394.1 hypothetical protein BTJ49_05450 [Oleiagrimonas sp. MCCC 1A03011]